jgi:hypothetical protein
MKKIIFLLLFASSLLLAEGKVLYHLDFSKVNNTNAIPWMKKQGFEFMLESKKLNLKIQNERLELSTTGEKAGLFGIRLKKELDNIGSVIIEWGVDKFPKNANWEKRNNRLALGAIFILGKEKFSSGLVFAKPVPYFLAPFIGEKEKVGKQYLGKLYKKAGRYYCVSNAKGLVVTKFNIDQKFKQAFKKNTPALTAFAFQMNTDDTTGGAKAFIKTITFYAK